MVELSGELRTQMLLYQCPAFDVFFLGELAMKGTESTVMGTSWLMEENA